MRIQDVKKLHRLNIRKSIYFIALLSVIIVNSGCELLGVLATPGAFEKKIPPEYDLARQQDRKILLWVECPLSSEVDYDVCEKLIAEFQSCLTKKAKIHPENIILFRPVAESSLAQEPVKIGREKQAGYVLLVQVEEYELIPMDVEKYYTGQMTVRSVLMDTDLGMAVWPRDPAGKVVSIRVDVETKGREMSLRRLLSGTAHCTLRYLYPCDKLKFKSPDETLSIQDAFETETF